MDFENLMAIDEQSRNTGGCHEAVVGKIRIDMIIDWRPFDPCKGILRARAQKSWESLNIEQKEKHIEKSNCNYLRVFVFRPRRHPRAGGPAVRLSETDVRLG